MEYTRDELLNLFAKVRQAALTESLGQVTCPDGAHGFRTWCGDLDCSTCDPDGTRPCPDCGAAV